MLRDSILAPVLILAVVTTLLGCAPSTADSQPPDAALAASPPGQLTLPPDAAADAPVPLVLLVHGRAGLPLYGERLDGLARRLADAGIAAFVLDYFTVTGDTPPPPYDEARFAAWQSAVDSALGTLAARPDIDGSRLGIAGFSLGAYLSTVEAASDPRLRAVAANYAVLADAVRTAERFPPLLVLHAHGDPLAPVAGAEELAASVRAKGTEVEVEIYDADTHVLEGDDWDASVERMVRFFVARLGAADQGL